MKKLLLLLLCFTLVGCGNATHTEPVPDDGTLEPNGGVEGDLDYDMICHSYEMVGYKVLKEDGTETEITPLEGSLKITGDDEYSGNIEIISDGITKLSTSVKIRMVGMTETLEIGMITIKDNDYCVTYDTVNKTFAIEVNEGYPRTIIVFKEK